MNFFKSYTGAMTVMVVVIVLSILGGSHRSLTAERNKVEALFYSGTDGSGYSIQTDLDERCAIAANLLTVAGRYLGKDDTADVSAFIRQLERADSPPEKYEWNQALGEAAETLLTKLEGCALSEKDAQYVRGFRTDLNARADTIARDGYNGLADQFNTQVLGSFPANILSKLTFVRQAEAFR